MVLFCLLSILAVLCGSCTSANRLEGYIYYRLNANPTTLDPALIVDVAGGAISAKLFNGLVRVDENMKIIPDIAAKWTLSRDGLTYRFKLRNGVKFSNNRQVTAKDFKYSFKRILEPSTRSPKTWVLEKILGAREFMEGRARDVGGIKVIDDYTLELRLESPFSPFLSLLTMSAAYVVPEEEVRKWGADFSTHPAGTGPFVLSSWMQNRALRLEKREDYFEDRARVRGIIYRIIPEDITAMAEFEAGNLDAFAIPASEITRYRENPKWKGLIESVAGLNIYYLGMNCSRQPFSSVNLRKAVNFAIDRNKLLNTFYGKRGSLAAGPVPDLLRKWDMPRGYEYKPEKAKELVLKEGMAGAAINFYVNAEQEVVDMAEFIQAYLNKAGLNIKIKQMEWSAYKEAVNKGEADMFWLSWWADYPDPENFLFPLFHSSNTGPAGNRAGYKNRETDRLIELGQMSQDEAKRAAYYKNAERMIVDDAPWVFFWHKKDYMVRQPGLRNFRLYPVYTMDKGTAVSF